jgi:hypothetical protein
VSVRLRAPLASVALLGLGLGLLRCAADSGARDSAGGSIGGAPSERPREKFELDLGSEGGGGGTSAALHALCNPSDAEGCLPDDPLSCADSDAPGQGGMGGEPTAGNGGSAGDGNGTGLDVACHLLDEGGHVVRGCAASGAGGLDAPCLSPANCAPGFTCVGEGASGLCRPYCCQGDQVSCGAGTYCAPRAVVGSRDAGLEPLEAPVCVRADQCKLSEEYPCPAGATCQCAQGTACVPVRADGTTSCIVPGTGTTGDACGGPFSCSYGHVCSRSRGCLKLCSTVSTRVQCADGEFCQALAGFPDDVGVCIALSETR